MDNLAPLVLFVYRRPELVKETLKYLSKCNLAADTDLYIYSDGPKDDVDRSRVNSVRKIISEVEGFKSVTITERPENYGLAWSVIDGANTTFDKFEKAIFLEEDLFVAPNFLEYMNEALETYKNNEDVFSVSGFTPDIKLPEWYKEETYLTRRFYSWSWATWKDNWYKIEWSKNYFAKFINDSKVEKNFKDVGSDLPVMLKKYLLDKLDSWAVRAAYGQFESGGYTLCPRKSLVDNVGFDGTGTHKFKNLKFNISPDFSGKKINLNKDIEFVPEIHAKLKNLYRVGSIPKQVLDFIRYDVIFRYKLNEKIY